MKLIKWASICIAILCLIFVGLLMMINPNDYREDIETQALDTAGLNLDIGGEIAWSLIPLGIKLNEITLFDQSNKVFTQFNNLTLQVDTFSLLSLKPQINKLLLDGLQINLTKDEKGQANWENLIIPSKEAAQTKDENETEIDPVDRADKPSLNFFVNTIEITNTQVSYHDKQTKQSFAVNELSLIMSEIEKGKSFPIDLSLALTSSALNNQTIPLNINGFIAVEPDTKTLSLTPLKISLANFILEAQLELQQQEDKQLAEGRIEIPAFDLKELLENLGQPAIKTANDKALTQVSFSTDLNADDQQIQLSKTNIKVDQSTWTGNLNLNQVTQAIKLVLNGDKLVLDDYLPPNDPSKPKPNPANQRASSSKADQAELLPLETIKTLNLDIALKQAELITQDLPFKNTAIAFKAANGTLNLENASTQLFDGNIKSTARIVAKSEDVKWAAQLDVEQLNYLENVEKTNAFGWELGGSGDINIDAEVNARGNTLARLKQTTKGLINFAIDQGAVTGVNLNQLTCKGFAAINRKAITKTDWPNATKFNALTGQIKIDGQTIESPTLLLENVGLRAAGNGYVDLAKENLEYRLDINPNGELGDEACEVHEKVKGIAIPILCKGTFELEPAKLCQLDHRRMGRIVEKLAKKEAQRKLEKETDRAIDKQLNKFIDKDSELGNTIKQGLKGLFK